MRLFRPANSGDAGPGRLTVEQAEAARYVCVVCCATASVAPGACCGVARLSLLDAEVVELLRQRADARLQSSALREKTLAALAGLIPAMVVYFILVSAGIFKSSPHLHYARGAVPGSPYLLVVVPGAMIAAQQIHLRWWRGSAAAVVNARNAGYEKEVGSLDDGRTVATLDRAKGVDPLSSSVPELLIWLGVKLQS